GRVMYAEPVRPVSRTFLAVAHLLKTRAVFQGVVPNTPHASLSFLLTRPYGSGATAPSRPRWQGSPAVPSSPRPDPPKSGRHTLRGAGQSHSPCVSILARPEDRAPQRSSTETPDQDRLRWSRTDAAGPARHPHPQPVELTAGRPLNRQESRPCVTV